MAPDQYQCHVLPRGPSTTSLLFIVKVQKKHLLMTGRLKLKENPQNNRLGLIKSQGHGR